MVSYHWIIRNFLICLLQIDDRSAEYILFIIDPPKGIRDMGIIRKPVPLLLELGSRLHQYSLPFQRKGRPGYLLQGQI